MLNIETISDVELLGIVLDAPAIAQSIYRTSSRWQDLGRIELQRIPRVSEKRERQLRALVELSRRINSKTLIRGEALQCSEDVSAAYSPRLSHRKQEIFIALALDNSNRIVSEHEVAKGSLTEVQVHPREVYRKLIMDGAARAICIHNHPSGSPQPSQHDLAICRRLSDVGKLVGIALLDFIIVASDGSTSFRDLGLMAEER